mgnify:CR=1 FL=1
MLTQALRTSLLKAIMEQVTLFGAQTVTVDMLSTTTLMVVDSLQLLKDGKPLEQVMLTKVVKLLLLDMLSSVKVTQVQLVLQFLTDSTSKIKLI